MNTQNGLRNNVTGESIAFIGQKGIPKNFPGTSGVEAYVEQKALTLTRRGNTVCCYVRTWASPSHKNRYRGIQLIPVTSINTTNLDTPTYSFIASILAAFSNVSIVWYQGIGPAIFSFIPKIFGKKVYTTIHSLDWKRKKWGPLAKMALQIGEIFAMSFSEKVYVVSVDLQKYCLAKYHKNTLLDAFETHGKHKVLPDIIKRKYNLKKDSYVLFMGRFVPEKRIEWLIQAASKTPKIQLVLSGGSSHTDVYSQKLKKLSNKQNTLFTGYVFGNIKSELISNCKILVLPSALEGNPIIVREALEYGTKCLIPDFLKSEYPQNTRLLHYFDHKDYNNFLAEYLRLVT
jgi:glycosyltransferase involved in cell wall biosynthesis